MFFFFDNLLFGFHTFFPGRVTWHLGYKRRTTSTHIKYHPNPEEASLFLSSLLFAFLLFFIFLFLSPFHSISIFLIPLTEVNNSLQFVCHFFHFRSWLIVVISCCISHTHSFIPVVSALISIEMFSPLVLSVKQFHCFRCRKLSNVYKYVCVFIHSPPFLPIPFILTISVGVCNLV